MSVHHTINMFLCCLVKSETFKTVFVQKSSEFVCYWTALRPISTDRDMLLVCLLRCDSRRECQWKKVWCKAVKQA